MFYITRARFPLARELAEHCFALAQGVGAPSLLLEAHRVLGQTLHPMGEFSLALTHLEQGFALYDPQQHSSHAFVYGHDPGVSCLIHMACTLWTQGYPDQALKRSEEALALAEELQHPFTLAAVHHVAASIHQYRQEEDAMRRQGEAGLKFSSTHGFQPYILLDAILQGWALARSGKAQEGIAQIRQNLAITQAIGIGILQPYFLALLAEAHGRGGQANEGIQILAEALTLVDKTGERFYEAELYRLKGELLLVQEIKNQKSKGKRQK